MKLCLNDKIEIFSQDVRNKIIEINPRYTCLNSLLKEFLKLLNISLIINSEQKPFYKKKDDTCIVLPSYTSPLQDNFIIAHELGHYFLHNNNYNDSIGSIANIQANRFAMGLLLPKDDFIKARKQYNDDAMVIAAKFEVPVSIVKERMTYIN